MHHDDTYVSLSVAIFRSFPDYVLTYLAKLGYDVKYITLLWLGVSIRAVMQGSGGYGSVQEGLPGSRVGRQLSLTSRSLTDPNFRVVEPVWPQE